MKKILKLIAALAVIFAIKCASTGTKNSDNTSYTKLKNQYIESLKQ